LLEIDPSTYRAAVERARRRGGKPSLANSAANMAQAQRTYEPTAEPNDGNPSLVADEQLEQLRTTSM